MVTGRPVTGAVPTSCMQFLHVSAAANSFVPARQHRHNRSMTCLEFVAKSTAARFDLQALVDQALWLDRRERMPVQCGGALARRWRRWRARWQLGPVAQNDLY